MTRTEFAPVTPGDILKEEFLAEYALSQNQLAKARRHLAESDRGYRQQSPPHHGDTAVRLGLYFGNTAEFWMNLQTNFDLKMAEKGLDAAERKRIRSHRAA